MLPSVFDTCVPRDQIRAGDLSLDLFAAKLRSVVQGNAPHIYQQPAVFLASTFPTDGLKTLIAAVEAVKLGYGSQAYIRQLFGYHHETLALELIELNDTTSLEQERIRQPGRGRKTALVTIAELNEAFLRVLRRPTSGLPMYETLKSTNLKRHEIADLLQDEGITVSMTVVDQLLKKHYP